MLFKKRKRDSRLAKAVSEAVAQRARPFDGMEVRRGGPKPWPPGKPPGGKLPPEARPSAQNRPAET